MDFPNHIANKVILDIHREQLAWDYINAKCNNEPGFAFESLKGYKHSCIAFADRHFKKCYLEETGPNSFYIFFKE